MARPSVALFVVLLACGFAHAATFDLGLNDEAVRADFGWRLAGEHLVGDLSFFNHENDKNLAAFGVHAAGDATFSEKIYGGVGVNVFFGDDDSNDGFGMGLGGFFRWSFGDSQRLGLTVDAHFAPDVLVGGDLEGYTEVSARVGYQVLTSAEILLGYRYIELDPDDSSGSTLSSDMMFGFRLLWGADRPGATPAPAPAPTNP